MRKTVLMLTEAQVAELEDLAQTAPDPDVRLRAQAILHVVGDSGFRGAARALGVNESAVRKWTAAYLAEGVAGLLTREATGRPTKITANDRQRLASALARHPSEVGVAGDSWTARSLNEYLQAHSDTRVSDWTIWSLMRERQRANAQASDRNSVSTHTKPLFIINQEDSTMPNTLSVWDPMRDLLTMRQTMDRLLDDRWMQPRTGQNGAPGTLFLPIDVYSNENEVVLLASMPGLKADDVEIVLQGDTVTIKGEYKPLEGNVQWAIQERPYGKFSRSLTLNVPVDMGKADATFEDGILRLILPKAESAKPRQIQIKTKHAEPA
jgi:HSP20 family protein